MVIDAVPEARSYIVNRNGKGKSNGKGLAWPQIETAKHTHWVGQNPLEADRIALRPCEVLKKMCRFFREKNQCSGGFPDLIPKKRAKKDLAILDGAGQLERCFCPRILE